MSAHPALRELGARVKVLGKLELGHTLTNLGADLCTEFPALRVLRELITGWEQERATVTKLRARVAELEAAQREARP